MLHKPGHMARLNISGGASTTFERVKRFHVILPHPDEHRSGKMAEAMFFINPSCRFIKEDPLAPQQDPVRVLELSSALLGSKSAFLKLLLHFRLLPDSG